MLKTVSLSAILFIALLSFGVHHAFADIYKYVNEAGETSFADDLHSVPEKYRASAVNTTPPEKPKQIQQETQDQASTTAMPESEAPRVEPEHKLTFMTRLLMTVVVVFICFVVLFAINKTELFKGREKMLPAAKIALACFLSLYLIIVHARDVVHLFSKAGNEIEAVKEKQAERGKKAGKAIKAINSFMDDNQQPVASERAEEKGN